MKRVIQIITTLFFLFVLNLSIVAQTTKPGEPPGTVGGGDQPIGGGAPVGSGLMILLTLGVAYGSKKLYILRKEELEE